MSSESDSLPPPPPDAPRPGEGLATAILVVTFVAAAVTGITVRSPTPVGAAAVWMAVFITATLAFLDVRRLKAWAASHPATDARPLMSPAGIAAGFILLWAVVMPIYFWRRRAYGARNYFAWALLGSLALSGAAVAPLFLPHSLPAANAPEVVNLVQSVVEQSLAKQPDPARFGKPTITNAVELSFDQKRQVRDVKCTLTTNLGPEDFYYTVEWQDRAKNLFRVQTRAKP